MFSSDNDIPYHPLFDFRIEEGHISDLYLWFIDLASYF